MKKRSLLFGAALMGGFIGFAFAGPITSVSPPAGQFGLPFNVNQTGPLCSIPGYKERDQYHMQWNNEINPVTGLPINKYHMGEDWNGMCGGDTDEGYPLHALANGKVVFLDRNLVSGKGKRLYIRSSFPYAGVSGGMVSFDSAYLHMQDIDSGLTWTQGVPGSGSNVVKGQNVGTLGKTGTGTAHLHWEAQWDDTVSPDDNPYKNPLLKGDALRYRSPSLIVDDRRDVLGYNTPSPGTWYLFTMQGNAPSSTMYVLYNGQRKSLKNAIAAGWIPSEGILHESNGSWRYYNNVDNNFFENGKRYAIKTLITGPVYYIPVPRNGYQPDRARLDMIQAVAGDSRFSEVQVETFGTEAPWGVDAAWDIHWMRFKLSDGRTTYVNQVTYRANPLIRNTAYYDPDLGQWTSWQWVNWNRLY